MRTDVVPFVFAGVTGCAVPPELEDCRVTCSTDVEPPHDAGVSPPDDASHPSDDPPKPTGTLRVKISDKGRVDVVGIGSCDAANDDKRCDFVVELGVPRTLVATPQGNREFEKWEKACHGMIPTCIVVPTMPMTEVEAKFRKR